MAKSTSPGTVFGRLTVLEELPAEKTPDGKRLHRKVLCRCECGNQKLVTAPNLRSGNTRSCGCLHVETCKSMLTKHGKAGTPAYVTWKSMVARCTCRGAASWPNYGGRGIQVCDRWMTGENGRSAFECFLEDMGERPEGSSIERLDCEGDYSPENCVWADATQQSRNRRTVKLFELDGETRCLTEWAELHEISASTVRSRLGRGWTLSRALTETVRVV